MFLEMACRMLATSQASWIRQFHMQSIAASSMALAANHKGIEIIAIAHEMAAISCEGACLVCWMSQ
jgi:hypothetical protein